MSVPISDKISRYLPAVDKNTPIRLVKKGAWGTAAGFYSYATWQTAKAVIHTAASCGLNCLKNAEGSILMPYVKSGAILALKEGATCLTQTLQIPLLIGLTLASAGAAIYCVHKVIQKEDFRLRTPPPPPGKSPRVENAK
jgi:hypothetical protein